MVDQRQELREFILENIQPIDEKSGAFSFVVNTLDDILMKVRHWAGFALTIELFTAIIDLLMGKQVSLAKSIRRIANTVKSGVIFSYVIDGLVYVFNSSRPAVKHLRKLELAVKRKDEESIKRHSEQLEKELKTLSPEQKKQAIKILKSVKK